MRKTLILIFTFLFFSCFSQTKILSNLDLKNGEYQFYITNYGNFVILSNGKMEEPNRFLIKDQNTIREIIRNWKGKEVNYDKKCDFDYSIFITQNNKVVERIRYNSKCNFVESSSGNFEVKTNPFIKLKTNNTFNDYTLNTEKIDEARLLLNKALELKTIYVPYIENYRWKEYENKFLVEITKEKDSNKLKDIVNYKNKIHAKYPEDKFEIEEVENYKDSYLIRIYCHPDFWNKFNIYKKELYEPIEKNYSVIIFGDSREIEKITTQKQ